MMPTHHFILNLLLVTATCTATSVDSQFDVVAKGRFFIDRSLLLEKLFTRTTFEGPWKAGVTPQFKHHYYVIAPRKFGKSTNLSMMRQFFALDVNETGTVQAPNQTKYYALFKSLKIGRSPTFEKHFARFPVIYMNLAEMDVNGSLEDFMKSFCKFSRKIITEHQYLLRSEAVEDYLKEELKTFGDPQVCEKKRPGAIKFPLFGKNLTIAMHRHFKSRVMVLVDEIDAPAMSYLASNNTAIFWPPFFIRVLFRILSFMLDGNDEHVIGSFQTSSTTLGAHDSHNPVPSTYALDQEFKYFYGVTENEVKMLLSRAGIPVTTQLLTDLRRMYGGFGITDDWNRETVYNTQSVIKYCEHKIMKSYWEAESAFLPLKKLMTPAMYGPALEAAMYTSIPMIATDNPDHIDMVWLKSVLNNIPRADHGTFSLIVYLFDIGLFTECSKGCAYSNSSFSVKVPNDENRLILLDSVLNKAYYMAKHGVNEALVNDFVLSVAHLNSSGTSFSHLAHCTSRLFSELRRNFDNAVVFRYALYNYLRSSDKELFSQVIAELGKKMKRKSDIVVTRSDGVTVFMGLSFDQESGQDALEQVLEDERLKEIDNLTRTKCICLGINLLRFRCDVNYNYGCSNLSTPSTEIDP